MSTSPSLLDAPLSWELPTSERREDAAAMNKLARSKLVPLLVDRDAARAIDFYVRALGANEIARYMNVGFDVLVTPSRDS
jgi:hypothetical protein